MVGPNLFLHNYMLLSFNGPTVKLKSPPSHYKIQYQGRFVKQNVRIAIPGFAWNEAVAQNGPPSPALIPHSSGFPRITIHRQYLTEPVGAVKKSGEACHDGNRGGGDGTSVGRVPQAKNQLSCAFLNLKSR